MKNHCVLFQIDIFSITDRKNVLSPNNLGKKTNFRSVIENLSSIPSQKTETVYDFIFSPATLFVQSKNQAHRKVLKF